MVTPLRNLVSCLLLANAMCVFATEPSPQGPIMLLPAVPPAVPPHAVVSPVPLIANRVVEPYTTATGPMLAQPMPYGVLSDSQLEGFRTAMQHLEATGHREAAAELRSKFVELDLQRTKKLLAEKTRVIDQLQAELNELRGDVKPHTITLSFQMFELLRNELDKVDAKLDVANVLPHAKDQMGFTFVDDPAKLKTVIEALRKEGILRVLAEPTLATISGRRVTFHSGGEIPVPIPQGPGSDVSTEFRKFGTIIHATPHLLPDGKLRVEFCFRQTDPEESTSAVTVKGQRIPNFRTRQISTGMVIKPGQAYVISGLIQRRAEASKNEEGQPTQKMIETELMLVVTPQVHEAPTELNSGGRPIY